MEKSAASRRNHGPIFIAACSMSTSHVLPCPIWRPVSLSSDWVWAILQPRDFVSTNVDHLPEPPLFGNTHRCLRYTTLHLWWTLKWAKHSAINALQMQLVNTASWMQWHSPCCPCFPYSRQHSVRSDVLSLCCPYDSDKPSLGRQPDSTFRIWLGQIHAPGSLTMQSAQQTRVALAKRIGQYEHYMK